MTRRTDIVESPALPAPGTTVEVVAWVGGCIDESEFVPIGTRGVVERANEWQVWVKWENGATLALLPGRDEWREVPS